MRPNTDKCHVLLSKKLYNLWMQVDTEYKMVIIRNFLKVRLKNTVTHTLTQLLKGN